MQGSCHSSDLSSSEGIASFECFDSFLRLFTLPLLELGGCFWVVVASERGGGSFASAGRCERRYWEDEGFNALIFLQLSQFTEEKSELSVALVVSIVVAATGVAVVSLTCGLCMLVFFLTDDNIDSCLPFEGQTESKTMLCEIEDGTF